MGSLKDEFKKMTKAQLLAELDRIREAARDFRCECCGMTPREWDETPLFDGDEPGVLTDKPSAVFIPTCWAVPAEVEEPDDYEEDNDE